LYLHVPLGSKDNPVYYGKRRALAAKSDIPKASNLSFQKPYGTNFCMRCLSNAKTKSGLSARFSQKEFTNGILQRMSGVIQGDVKAYITEVEAVWRSLTEGRLNPLQLLQ
jgi:hypothetical protein